MVYKREITVQGGSGGNGCVSFRREKYLPLGGPDGGDGGNGGDVLIVANSNLADLSWMGWKREFVAGSGSRGGSWRKHGKKGEDLAISVPPGTVVFAKSKSGEQVVLADLRTSGQKTLAAKGGRGGLGNARFATAVNQAPKVATEGRPGVKRDITLEVKLVTDICIVGQPNSGKSSLLSAISRARPEIADYPFTTRQPVLGVVLGDKGDFVVAEIPGLVEGAHVGKGLGNEFLRHAERTKVLIYLVDGGSPTVIDDFKTLEKEIGLYKGLAHKPKLVAVNKVDLPEVRARLPQVKRYLSKHEAPAFYISALSGQAVLELTRKAMDMVEQASREEDVAPQAEIAIFRPRPRK